MAKAFTNRTKEASAKGGKAPAATKVPAAASAKKSSAKPKAAPDADAPPALEVSAKAPPFELPDENSRPVRLADFAGKKVIIYFYPKDDTSGCTREACGFRDQLAKLSDHGVTVLGISRDGAASHTRFKNKYNLGFPLLSDPDGAVHRAYGAWGTKSMYGKTMISALRTTVLIGEDGRVAKVWPKVKVDGHAEAVLAAATSAS
jgi:peroxiredoxin Q/BCP